MKVLKFSSLIALAFVFILTSCDQKGTKLANEKLSINNLVEIANKLKEDKSTSREEIDLFNAALARLGGNKDSIANKTVGQLIESQKEFTRTNSANSLISICNRYEINNAVVVNILQKLMVNQDTIIADGADIVIKNISDKAIKELKGEIQIFNKANQIVKVRPVNFVNLNIEAGKEVPHRELWPHDKNNPNDVYLREQKDLIGIWVPESVTFADGKKLSVIVK